MNHWRESPMRAGWPSPINPTFWAWHKWKKNKVASDQLNGPPGSTWHRNRSTWFVAWHILVRLSLCQLDGNWSEWIRFCQCDIMWPSHSAQDTFVFFWYFLVHVSSSAVFALHAKTAGGTPHGTWTMWSWRLVGRRVAPDCGLQRCMPSQRLSGTQVVARSVWSWLMTSKKF